MRTTRLIAVLAAFVLAACGGSSSSTGGQTNGGSGSTGDTGTTDSSASTTTGSTGTTGTSSNASTSSGSGSSGTTSQTTNTNGSNGTATNGSSGTATNGSSGTATNGSNGTATNGSNGTTTNGSTGTTTTGSTGTTTTGGTNGSLACSPGVYGFGIPLASVGDSPTNAVLTDVNHDNKLDLIVVNQASGEGVSVLTGYGDGTFASRSSFATTGHSPQGLTVGEFTGDTNPDIAVGDDYYAGSVSILRGYGTGAFTSAFTISPRTLTGSGAYFYPIALANADLNGDGHPDLIVGNDYVQQLALYYGQDGGGLDGGIMVGPATSPGYAALAVADLSGDQKPDVAALVDDNSSVGSVKLYLNSGGSLVAQSGALSVVGSAASIAVGDLNHDSVMDLVVAGYYGVSVLLGQGNASYATATTLTTGITYPGSVQIADVDHDGAPDIVVGSQEAPLAQIFYGDGAGHFARTAIIDVPTSLGGAGVTDIAAGDLNGDGHADLAFVDGYGDLGVALANNAGTLLSGQYLAGTTTNTPTSPVAVDINADGRRDLVELNPSDQAFTVFLAQAGGGYAAPVPYSLAVSSYPVGLVVADFTGDGKPDVVVANSGTHDVEMRPGDGLGSFGQPKSTSVTAVTSSVTQAIAAADFLHHNKLDVAVIDGSDSKVWILPNQPSGNSQFGTPVGVSLSGRPSAVVAGHFSSGPGPDLAVLDANTAQVITLLNDGAGNFTGSASTSLAGIGRTISVVPGSGGALDSLIVAESGGVDILSSPNAGSFTRTAAPAVSGPRGAAMADVNGDQVPDLVITSSGSDGQVLVLLGLAGGGYGTPLAFAAGSPGQPLLIDLDGDGSLDVLATTNQGLSYWLNSCWPGP